MVSCIYSKRKCIRAQWKRSLSENTSLKFMECEKSRFIVVGLWCNHQNDVMVLKYLFIWNHCYGLLKSIDRWKPSYYYYTTSLWYSLVFYYVLKLTCGAVLEPLKYLSYVIGYCALPHAGNDLKEIRYCGLDFVTTAYATN